MQTNDVINQLREQVAELQAQRDNAWQELREIREAINANPEESTADEVRRVIAESDALAAQVEIMQGNFEHILHYWNRDSNQEAMENACWMAVNTSADMINLDKYNCLHDVKSNAIREFINWATANVDPEFAEWQDFANTYAAQLRAKAGKE